LEFNVPFQHKYGCIRDDYKLVINLPAVLLLLFCGAWSDRVGRKLPVVLSSFGTVIAVIFFMISRVMMPT